jgi:hypothetical protein
MKIKISCFFSAIAFCLISCSPITKSLTESRLSVETGTLPANFNEGSIMLFITHERETAYDRYLKKNVIEGYKGPYELVSWQELKQNEKYNDLEKYRFFFDYNAVGVSHDGREFYIKDRKTFYAYKSPVVSASWAKVIKVYVEKLNALLITE